MSSIDINHIKKNYSIIDLAKRLGIKVFNNNMCKCPFHKEGQENNPSMGFHKASNTFKCFACNTKGSNIDLVMKYLNYDFKEACYYIAGHHNTYNDVKSGTSLCSVREGKQTTNKVVINPSNVNIDTNYHEIYDFMLSGTKYTCSGDSYLKSRGITIGSSKGIEIKITLNTTLLAHELKNKFSMNALISSGLFNEFDMFVYKNDYLLIPYFYKDGRIITVKSRNTKEKIYKNLKGRPLYLYGINHLYSKTASNDIKNVYICEGEIDALSMLECGLVAVSVGGVNNWKDIYTRELLKYNVIFAGDNDKAGEMMYNALVESFAKHGRPISCIDLCGFKGCKDINELLNK